MWLNLDRMTIMVRQLCLLFIYGWLRFGILHWELHLYEDTLCVRLQIFLTCKNVSGEGLAKVV